MSHTAQTTYYGLPIYEDKAGNQPTYLGDWNETMRTIDSSLNAVAAQSSGVVNTANQALSTAQQSQQTANAANTVANSAQQTASGLSEKVQTAQTTAEQANTAAGTAQSTAESANSTAQQASTTASNALSQAQTANSTAGTANSTATSAQSTANAVAAKCSGFAKIGVISKVFTTSEDEYVEFTGTEIDTAVGGHSGTIAAFACNGDVDSAPLLQINTVGVHQATGAVRVYLGANISSSVRINLLVIRVAS